MRIVITGTTGGKSRTLARSFSSSLFIAYPGVPGLRRREARSSVSRVNCPTRMVTSSEARDPEWMLQEAALRDAGRQ